MDVTAASTRGLENELERGTHGGTAYGVSFWVGPVALCLILYWHMVALKRRWVVYCSFFYGS